LWNLIRFRVGNLKRTSDYVYDLTIRGEITHRELQAMEAVAKLVPRDGVVVEVGSYLGRSSWAWAKSVDPSVTG